jgi:hypothetical protein
MATLQATTASNEPRIDAGAIGEVESVIDDYEFVGNFDTLTVEIIHRDDEGSEPRLTIHGHACFEASQPVYDADDSVIDHEYDCTEEFLTRIAPHLKESLVVETVGHEKCRFPLLASQWVVYPDGPVVSDSFEHRPEEVDIPKPDYTYLKPSCPLCGHDEFASATEGAPAGFDAHYIHVTCSRCGTCLTIEYRAIDISWYSAHEGQHSAISQGLLSPCAAEYNDPKDFPPVPDDTLLSNIDWPVHCNSCGESLTGNNILAEPNKNGAGTPQKAKTDEVVFKCPNCEQNTELDKGADAESN